MNDFHYAMSLLDTMYGINMPEDQFEEIALVGWNLIGNLRTKLYRYCVDGCDGEVELPCNCVQLEAVTLGLEDWAYTTNQTPNGDWSSFETEQYIERRKQFKDPLYVPGRFIKYEKVGNTLYFGRPHGRLMIVYKGLVVDDNGLPELTDKEASELATYCAYVTKFKEGLATNNQNIMQMAGALKSIWTTQVDQARNDRYLSQNEINEILDAKTSWNRKIFNKSFKLYK